MALAGAFIGAAAALTSGAPASAAATGVTVAGGNGAGPAANQLNNPFGVAVDSSGNVYVADTNNNRVQMWAPGATSGVTVAGGNGAGPAANQLNYPLGVGLDSSGNLYVADANNSRVQEWAPGATSGITVAGGNGAGPAANQVTWPEAVAVDSAGNLYVADSRNGRVQEWSPGATSGVTIARVDDPGGLAVDSSGNLYVADTRANRVQKWAEGAKFGVTVAGGNGRGSAANQLHGPIGVVLDSSGNLYVADDGSRVQKWAPGATSGVTVAGGNGLGSAANQLVSAAGVALDSSGKNLYVADTYNDRVQEWPTDGDLALSQPSNITHVRATSPSGEVVGYAPPTVTDEESPLPVPSCNPPSGSTFAIGKTTVTCTVSDSDDTNSPVTVSFTVSVLGAAEQLAHLQHSVIGVGRGTSLYDRLGLARAYLSAHHVRETCGSLKAFITEVRTQTGKYFNGSTGYQLIHPAQRIEAVLAC
jgi:sugar lactone lactonase YvrE